MPLLNPHALGAQRVATAQANLRRTIVGAVDALSPNTDALVVDGLAYQQFWFNQTAGAPAVVTMQFTARTIAGVPEWLNYGPSIVLAVATPQLFVFQITAHAIRASFSFAAVGDTVEVLLSGTAT